ncbi:MAG TPA: SRPBCC domain-containing protein [Opitutaceae bacterium]
MKILLLAGAAILSGCTSVQTQVEINAPAKDVRSVLLRFEDYPRWNPFIVKVDGTVAEGSKVRVTVKPVGKDPISGETTVTALTDTRLAWTGSLAVPGLFSGNHEFIIESEGPSKTRFHQNESMSGLIIPFFNFKPEAEGFEQMNQALKREAESGAR